MQWPRSNAIGRMEAACRELLAATPERTEWAWDDDYIAALVVVRSPLEAGMLEQLQQIMPYSWGQLDIDNAPSQVRHVCGIWGGLMTGQRLFVLEPADDPMTFATWWPWGNRLKFSLRVSCYGRSDIVVRTDPQGKLRGFFGL